MDKIRCVTGLGNGCKAEKLDEYSSRQLDIGNLDIPPAAQETCEQVHLRTLLLQFVDEKGIHSS